MTAANPASCVLTLRTRPASAFQARRAAKPSISLGTVRARALLTAQSDAAIKGVCRFIEEAISYMANDAGRFDVPLPAVLGSGAKSAGNLARLRAHIDRGPSGVY